MPKKEIKKRKKKSKELIRSNGVKVMHPTSKTCWKSFERLVAGYFGTKRVPLSGSNSGHNTNSDSLHPDIYIECKVRGKFSVWALFSDTEQKAKVENKIPLCALKQKGEKGWLVLIRPDDIVELAKLIQAVKR